MPNYTFRDKRTGDEFTESMSIAQLDMYLETNKHLIQVIRPSGFIPGINMKPDDGFRDLLREMKKHHPGNTIETF